MTDDVIYSTQYYIKYTAISKNILEIKYETEKYIAFKTNKIRQFKKKWEMFEVFHLI